MNRPRKMAPSGAAGRSPKAEAERRHRPEAAGRAGPHNGSPVDQGRRLGRRLLLSKTDLDLRQPEVARTALKLGQDEPAQRAAQDRERQPVVTMAGNPARQVVSERDAPNAGVDELGPCHIAAFEGLLELTPVTGERRRARCSCFPCSLVRLTSDAVDAPDVDADRLLPESRRASSRRRRLQTSRPGACARRPPAAHAGLPTAR